MKRTLTLSLGLVLGGMLAVPALAQDNFPDVESNHWAYDALENLRAEGILVGYPDGKFRGSRLATRYELAQAINAAYKKMMSVADGLSEQIKAMEDAMGGGSSDAGLGDSLKALKASVDGMKGWGDDIASMKKLVEEFESELTGLGADVDMMKEKLGSLDARVTKLEGVKLPVSISGDASILVVAGNSRDKRLGLNKEGRTVGANDQAGGAQGGLTKDTNIYHELALNLAGTNDSGPKWNATVVFGNLLGPNGVLADMVNTPAGDYRDQANGDYYIDNFAVKFDSSVGGLGFNAEVGRVKSKVSPLLFERADNTLYFSNARLDDGYYRMDGANITFNFGGADVAVMAGRNAGRNTNNGVNLGSIPLGVDNTLGATVGFNLGTFGRLNAAYLYHQIDDATPANQPNRLNVMGAEFAGEFGGIGVTAGYGKSIMTHNTKNIGLDRLNQAAYATATYGADNWGVTAEYRKIQTNYAAQGAWRRIGTNLAPTNFQAFAGHVWFKASDAMKLHGLFESGETLEAQGGIPSKTDLTNFVIGLDYKLNDTWTANLGYEDVKIKVPGANLKQRWATVGLGYNLGTNALLNFAYEYGAVDQTRVWGNANVGTYRGGQLTSQLTIRF